MYILKSIIHDWDDRRSLAILRNVRQAMAKTARLLVVERLIPADGEPSFELATYDVMMMVLSNGRERTEAEYRALLATAGFAFKRVVPTPTVFSISEAELDDPYAHLCCGLANRPAVTRRWLDARRRT